MSLNSENNKILFDSVRNGEAYLGIEFGSTRIKAVLIDREGTVLADGSYNWESHQENGIWSYHLDEVRTGLQAAYSTLATHVQTAYGATIHTLKGICISGMMHGYLPLDENANPLVPFRTWRNTITEKASEELTELFDFQIPQRWSIAHLYQAILNKEPHVPSICHLVTLAVYVHYLLTGEINVGLCEASGMFPVDSSTGDYNSAMLKKLNDVLLQYDFPWNIKSLLPEIRMPGTCAGYLTAEGARLLDPSGALQPGIPFSAPEGDAATGMLATNSLQPQTGNISAGTSIFATVILEKPFQYVHPAIDLLVSPTGKPAAMVHCNNGTNEINAWAFLFQEICCRLGGMVNNNSLFDTLFRLALEGQPDCGDILVFNTSTGEPILGINQAVPLTLRSADSRLSAGNFMRAQLYACLAPLRLGMDLLEANGVTIRELVGHGGFFKTPEVGQRLMASALKTTISVMETAGEGGAWGAALLAAYLGHSDVTLEEFTVSILSVSSKVISHNANTEDAVGFDAYLKKYVSALSAEKAAVLNF